MKITKALVDKVAWLLKSHPTLRDDDDYLFAMVWRSEVGETNHSKSIFSFLGGYAKGEYSKAESIRRTRQKLQEKVPELRGKLWNKRHKKGKDFPVESLEKLDEYVNQQGDLFNAKGS